MKVIPFRIPKTIKEAIRVQVDKGRHFYENLHQHPELQITLIVRSEGVLIAGDYVGNFTEGDVFIIGKNQAHVFRNDKIYFEDATDLTAEGITVFFDDNYFGEFFWNLDEMSSVRQLVSAASGGLRIKGEAQFAVANLLKTITQQSGLEKLISFFTILKTLSETTDFEKLSLAESALHTPQYDHERMNKIVKYTLQEYHNAITIESIAHIANLTSEAFCRYFKLRTRKTYIHFLSEIRINQACKLLQNKDLLMADIAYQVGFNNLSNFNRVFKMMIGKTPSQYCKNTLSR
jgi:AraC-like DNA-binding protein